MLLGIGPVDRGLLRGIIGKFFRNSGMKYGFVEPLSKIGRITELKLT